MVSLTVGRADGWSSGLLVGGFLNVFLARAGAAEAASTVLVWGAGLLVVADVLLILGAGSIVRCAAVSSSLLLLLELRRTNGHRVYPVSKWQAAW